jgi:DNA repair exonuclease SbcCD nuclease subunit
MRLLVVGDVHATQNELEECERLLQYVESVAESEKSHGIVFLGDIFDRFALVHVQVMDFWLQWAERLSEDWNLMFLVGNHDRPGDATIDAHALQPLHRYGRVIDKSDVIARGVTGIGYTTDAAKALEWAKEHPYPDGTLFCHAGFNGFEFENGRVVEDGWDPEAFPQKHIICGHYHTPQETGKVWYVGSPRWRHIGDANQERGIWTVDFDDKGNIVGKKFHSTKHVCRPMYVVEDRPEAPAEIPTDGLVVIDIYGPVDYVTKRKKALARDGVRIRTFPTTRRAKAVRESEGVGVAFTKFLGAFVPKNGTPKDVLAKRARERLGWTA